MPARCEQIPLGYLYRLHAIGRLGVFKESTLAIVLLKMIYRFYRRNPAKQWAECQFYNATFFSGLKLILQKFQTSNNERIFRLPMTSLQ